MIVAVRNGSLTWPTLNFILAEIFMHEQNVELTRVIFRDLGIDWHPESVN